MPEAGWYDDPDDATQLRYWDGSGWTDERMPRETPPPPPPFDPGVWGASADAPAAGLLTAAAPPRTFVEAIKVCLTKYVDGKGRASRSEYWYFALFHFIVVTVTGGIGEIVLLLPAITVTVRRLHDIGKSAWALLWILVPIVGWILLLVYAVRPGEQRMNQYG